MAMLVRLLAVWIAGLPLCSPSLAADELPVDLELVLAVDASYSIERSEQAIQRSGYVSAFRQSELLNAIRSGPYGRIAVTYIEWAAATSQRVIVPWTLVDDAASAERFAAALADARSYRLAGTSISGALAFSYQLFGGNGFAGDRLAIDI